MPDVRLARTLGWFGVGLGATEVAALAGLPDGRRTLRAFGLREIASGILTRPAAAWLWAHIAGDVVDRPAADRYRFWREVENLPRFMEARHRGAAEWRQAFPLGRARSSIRSLR